MKKCYLLLCLGLLLCLFGCARQEKKADIIATTRPVYDFTSALCRGTELEVGLLVEENVSCLHDYSLSTTQMRNIETAKVLVMSGAGLEAFPMEVLNRSGMVIDASDRVPLLQCEQEHDHEHEDHGHNHEVDSHIWLAPENAMIMAENICAGLTDAYPLHADIFQANLEELLQKLMALQQYGEAALQELSCREIITFHDGFGYLAKAFDLHILEAIEEESGSEASARELIGLIEILQLHQLPAIFTETNGSSSAAGIISRETGVPVYVLDMGMSRDYFDMMYHNINTLKEALE